MVRYNKRMAHLSLSLLGAFQARLDGQLITRFHSDKVRALLAYLAVEAEQPHSRTQLAGLLWPDWPEQAARTYLRQALFDLRRLFSDRGATKPFLLATHQTIQFNLGSDHGLDVATLDKAYELVLVSRQSSTRSELDQLQQAAALYTGSFMEGFFLDGCSAYEEWQLLVRERLQRQVVQMLHALVDGYEQMGDYGRALEHAWRRVELEPLLDEANWQVIHLLGLTGAAGAALTHYQQYCQILDEELGAPPAAEITTLIEEIKSGRSPAMALPRSGSAFPSPVRAIPRLPLPPYLSATSPPSSRTPFVARDREITQLTSYLNRVLDAQGRAVFVCGDAGQGKTALLHEFARLAQETHPDLVVATGHCNAHTGIGDPYLPFRELFGLLLGDIEAPWRAGTITRRQAIRLWNVFPYAVQQLANDGPELLDALVPGEAFRKRVADTGLGDHIPLDRWRRLMAVKPPSPGLQQAALFEQASDLLQSLAQACPLMLILDDLHWADCGSISLLFHIGRRLAGSPILLIGSYRPEEIALGRDGQQHPLENILNEFQQDFGDIVVDLRQADGREFVNALIDTQPNQLGPTFREALHRQSRGHALFTVELLRTMQARGDLVRDRDGRWVEETDLNWEALPARVEAAIAQRINRLPSHLRNMLAAASMEGERFTAEVVAQVQGLDERDVIHWLSAELDRKHQLVTAHDIRRMGEVRLSHYRFRHILFQRYLYNSLDDVERTVYHEEIGNALEKLYSVPKDEMIAQAAQLAWHFRQAEIFHKAIAYLYQAGAQAVRVSANEEAIDHLETALSLLENLAEANLRTGWELKLQIQRVAALGFLYGHGNPMVAPVYKRVLGLAQQMKQDADEFLALHGLWRYYWICGDLDSAGEFAKQMLIQAEKRQDDILLAHAYCAKGHIYFTCGDLVKSRQHLEQALVCSAAEGRPDLSRIEGDDLEAISHQFLAFCFWFLGYPEQALVQVEQALTRADHSSHPSSLAHAHIGTMALHQYRREVDDTRRQAEIVLALSHKYGFVQWISWASFMRGWALVKQTKGRQGHDEMMQGATAWLDRIWGARVRAIMADAYATSGRIQEGLRRLDQALEIAEKIGERLYEAEIHRLKGELLEMLCRERKQEVVLAEIEACYRQAIEVARQQQAKSLELRATVSLCRFWQQQGKSEAAKNQLAEVYAWFTEGFDTPDLKAAKALLEEFY